MQNTSVAFSVNSVCVSFVIYVFLIECSQGIITTFVNIYKASIHVNYIVY